jgi:hypothetical protein
MNGNGMTEKEKVVTEEEAVQKWLETIGFVKYYSALVGYDCDSMDMVKDLDAEDLDHIAKEYAKITSLEIPPMHAKKLTKAITMLNALTGGTVAKQAAEEMRANQAAELRAAAAAAATAVKTAQRETQQACRPNAIGRTRETCSRRKGQGSDNGDAKRGRKYQKRETRSR